MYDPGQVIPTEKVNDQRQTQEEDFQQTQLVDQASQQPPDETLWGILWPCNANNKPIRFFRNLPRYRIGRHSLLNDIILPGFKVSNEHCVLKWDGVTSSKACVTVTDSSSNGTFINGDKIGKGVTRVLREGNEIAFGTASSLPGNSVEDYRFIFRLLAGGEPKEGLYSEFDLMQELGKGTFATVMKALERATGIERAIKMIHNKPTGSPESEENRRKQLVREIEIMKSLKHPNICGLHKVFEQNDGALNLVLDLVTGGDLLDYIIESDGLSEERARHLTYQMCDALAYVHSKNIAHRDLKPENILITQDDPPIVKIADFGLAKVADSVTMLRTMCGTPSYLAPEVVSQTGESGYGNVVDAWSLGVIVYSMLTNCAPFIEDEDIQDLRVRIQQRQIYWEPLLQKGISLEAQDFVRCLLFTDPTQRMTLSEALHHPWFATYRPATSFENYPDYVPPSQRYAPFTSAFSSMSVDVPDQPSQSRTNGLHGQPSGLVRRSKLVSEAADNDTSLPSPPQEMVQNWERTDSQNSDHPPTQPASDPVPTQPESDYVPTQRANEGPEPSTITPGLNGFGKRSLSPMSDVEDANGDVLMDVASPRKKPRQSQDSSSGSDETPGGKGKGKKRQQHLMDSVVPRRSARNARPAAR